MRTALYWLMAKVGLTKAAYEPLVNYTADARRNDVLNEMAPPSREPSTEDVVYGGQISARVQAVLGDLTAQTRRSREGREEKKSWLPVDASGLVLPLLFFATFA